MRRPKDYCSFAPIPCTYIPERNPDENRPENQNRTRAVATLVSARIDAAARGRKAAYDNITNSQRSSIEVERDGKLRKVAAEF